MNPDPPNVDDLMTTYAPALLRYAERLVRNPHAAQDVVQNVFIRYARLPVARQPAPEALRGWLYRVTHNQAVDLIRGEQRRKRLHLSHAENGERAASVPDERKQIVMEALHLLNEKEKAVFLLRLEEGLSYREIEQITGFKEGHIGYLLHQAVRTLSAHLQPDPAA
jgi:RNA polymerase sigma-70 factor (ECF subfamily)